VVSHAWAAPWCRGGSQNPSVAWVFQGARKRGLENHLAVGVLVGPTWVAVLVTASLSDKMAVEGWLSVAWSRTQVSGKSCLGGALVPGRFAESFGSLGVSRRSEGCPWSCSEPRGFRTGRPTSSPKETSADSIPTRECAWTCSTTCGRF
jgi:hypothetical protein